MNILTYIKYIYPFVLLNKEAIGLLKAKRLASSIREIDYKEIYDSGIRVLAFDVDQTLVPYNGDKIDEGNNIAIGRAIEIFEDNVCILSNQSRKLKNCEILQIFPHTWDKPHRSAFEAVEKFYKVKPEQCMLVGDRLLTDILGANTAGWMSIKVKPYKKQTDPFPIGLIRKYEDFLDQMPKGSMLKIIKRRTTYMPTCFK
jgi:HAD superfamily phosphatase (TIGR01668 family)